MTTKPNEPEAQKLRDLIAEIAADLSTENPFWTAKLLADALITRGIGIVAVQPVADAGGVTAADREAAVKAARETDYTDVCIARMKQGLYDHFPFVQAFARHRHEARAEALEEAAFAAHGAIFDLALSDAGNGRNVTPAQYSEAAIDAIRALRSGEREGAHRDA